MNEGELNSPENTKGSRICGKESGKDRVGESLKKKWTIDGFRGLGINFYQELCQRIARDRRNSSEFLDQLKDASSKNYGVWNMSLWVEIVLA